MGCSDSQPEFDGDPVTCPFLQRYDVGSVLGRGSYSVVRLVTLKTGPNVGAKFACKIIKKAELKPCDQDALVQEICTLKQLNHPNIVELMEVMEDDTKHYLVFELCEGGELFDRIAEKENGQYSEKEARALVKILLEVMVYVHDLNVCHRDLKVRCILCTTYCILSSVK